MGLNPLLKGQQISFSSGENRLLRDVSIEIREGQLTALLGPNGSGKTTLLKILAGIKDFKSGEVHLGGKNLSTLSKSERARSITYVSPTLHIEFPIRVFDVVMLGRTCHNQGILSREREEDLASVRLAMEFTHCWDLRERDFNSLSDGEKQRVAVSRALAQKSKILLLDEALSKMDLNFQVLMAGKLKELTQTGVGVLLVTHDFNLASEYADYILFLKEGQLMAHGETSAVFSQAHISELYPQSGLRVLPSPISNRPKIFPPVLS